MPPFLDWLFPDQIPLVVSIIFILSSFATSALTAAVGLGGGVTLIAIMASLMPASALVPVHGVVQFGSNAGRAIVQRRHVDLTILLWFTAGAVIGAALGGAIAVKLPDHWLRFGIALFILWIVWGKAPRLGHVAKQAMGIAGFLATLLSMFFGAAGPIGGSVLSTLGLSRHQFVANQAATALVMHVLKIIAFGLLGFSFAPWLGLILLMIISGFLGTLAGSRLLGRMEEKTFKKGFRVVMTLLAFNLLWQALPEIFS